MFMIFSRWPRLFENNGIPRKLYRKTQNWLRKTWYWVPVFLLQGKQCLILITHLVKLKRYTCIWLHHSLYIGYHQWWSNLISKWMYAYNNESDPVITVLYPVSRNYHTRGYIKTHGLLWDGSITTGLGVVLC
jgi:hypothetical protein